MVCVYVYVCMRVCVDGIRKYHLLCVGVGRGYIYLISKVYIIVNNQKQSTNLFQVSLISVHLVFAHLRAKIEVTSSDHMTSGMMCQLHICRI